MSPVSVSLDSPTQNFFRFLRRKKTFTTRPAITSANYLWLYNLISLPAKVTSLCNLELKPQFMVLTAVTFLSSCVSDNKMKDHEYPSSDVLSLIRLQTEIPYLHFLRTTICLEALNTLQVSTDQIHHLYSTFAGINQPCYPPDTSFVLSQSDLLIALKHFVNIHCTNLNITKRNELSFSAVLAQKEYTLFPLSGSFRFHIVCKWCSNDWYVGITKTYWVAEM